MFRYFLLILYQAHADLRAERQRTHAGFLWWVIEPVLHMVIYYFVFAVLFQRGTEDFVPFLLIGLVVWRWFQVSLMQGASAILNGRRLMQQVYLPKMVFPTVTMLTNTVKFGFTMAILLVFLWVYGLLPSQYYLALLPVLFVQQLFIAGAVYLCAAILPFVPDIRLVLDNAMRAMIFLSGIFFAGSSVPEPWQFYFYLNPMAVLIEAYRDVLLYGQWPDVAQLAYVLGFALATGLAGWQLLKRFDYRYPKVLG